MSVVMALLLLQGRQLAEVYIYIYICIYIYI